MMINQLDFHEELYSQKTNFENYVEQANSSPYWQTVSFDGFVLPAQTLPKHTCGKYKIMGCDNLRQHPENKHYVHSMVMSCKSLSCQRCFVDGINRQANRSARRTMKYAEKRKFHFRHVILSPPQEESKSMNYDRLKKWLTYVCKIANIGTAMVVFHPFRFQDRHKSMPYLSPHFHLLVYGKITNTNEFYNKTGWTIKNKGDLNNEVSIFNCVRYLLSHAGIRKRTHSVRYLGDISYRKLKLEKEPNYHVCPYCELPLTMFELIFWEENIPPPLDFVGLWDSDCFQRVSQDIDGRLPFYQTNDENKIVRFDLFSFQESLSINTQYNRVYQKIQEINDLKYISSLNCHKITEF